MTPAAHRIQGFRANPPKKNRKPNSRKQQEKNKRTTTREPEKQETKTRTKTEENAVFFNYFLFV